MFKKCIQCDGVGRIRTPAPALIEMATGRRFFDNQCGRCGGWGHVFKNLTLLALDKELTIRSRLLSNRRAHYN